MLCAVCTLLCLAGPSPARTGSQTCQSAAHFAARETGVPVAVLMAVSLSETGRTVDGSFMPWPWTLNIAGDGHWLADQDAALAMAHSTYQSGRKNFDVGCFQVNYRWHGQAFDSLKAMLDPNQNALYAARFLARLHRETGSWSQAAGFYHSRTPHHAERYRQIFDRHFAALADGPVPHLSADTPRINKFPLLQAGGRGQGASLVPLQSGQMRRVLAPAAVQPFWNGS